MAHSMLPEASSATARSRGFAWNNGIGFGAICWFMGPLFQANKGDGDGPLDADGGAERHGALGWVRLE